MSDNQAINPDQEIPITGKEIEVEKRNDGETAGNERFILDQMVNHGSEPLTPTFGLISSRVYNERNSKKSRREDTYVNTADLFDLPSWEKQGLEELGADEIITHTGLEDTTNFDLEDLTAGHLILSDAVEGIDRVHGRRTKRTVNSWEPRITEILSSPDAGGKRVVITRQVVKESDAWPTIGDETIEVKREQIGYDKFEQTVVEAPDGKGTLATYDNFGMEGCQTKTTVTKENINFEMPPRGDTMISQTLQQLNDIEQLYTVVELVDGWPTFVSYEEEPVTGKQITITRTFHQTEEDALSVVAVDGAALQSIDVRHTACNRWMRTVREVDISITSETFLEYHSVDYYFPPYLDPEEPFLIFELAGGTEIINPVKSSPHRLKIPCRFEITYHTSCPAASEVFQFKPVNIEFNTGARVYHERAIITDGFTITLKVINEAFRWAVDNTTDGTFPAWFYEDVNFTFQASSPTATEWVENMTSGIEEALILEDSTRWKYNLWRRIQVYMPFPDLTQTLDGSLIY